MSASISRTGTLTFVRLAALLSLLLGGCPGPTGTQDSGALAPPVSGIVPGVYIGSADCEVTSALGGFRSSSTASLSVEWDGIELVLNGIEVFEGQVIHSEAVFGQLTEVVSNISVSSTSIQVMSLITMLAEFPDETVKYTGSSTFLLTRVDDSTLRYEDTLRVQGMFRSGVLGDLSSECSGTLRR